MLFGLDSTTGTIYRDIMVPTPDYFIFQDIIMERVSLFPQM